MGSTRKGRAIYALELEKLLHHRMVVNALCAHLPEHMDAVYAASPFQRGYKTFRKCALDPIRCSCIQMY
jgi:hypothetical protein